MAKLALDREKRSTCILEEPRWKSIRTNLNHDGLERTHAERRQSVYRRRCPAHLSLPQIYSKRWRNTRKNTRKILRQEWKEQRVPLNEHTFARREHLMWSTALAKKKERRRRVKKRNGKNLCNDFGNGQLSSIVCLREAGKWTTHRTIKPKHNENNDDRQ